MTLNQPLARLVKTLRVRCRHCGRGDEDGAGTRTTEEQGDNQGGGGAVFFGKGCGKGGPAKSGRRKGGPAGSGRGESGPAGSGRGEGGPAGSGREKLTLESVKKHVAEDCEMAPVKCGWRGSCHWKGPRKDQLAHEAECEDSLDCCRKAAFFFPSCG